MLTIYDFNILDCNSFNSQIYDFEKDCISDLKKSYIDFSKKIIS
jgi:hypothetical protein